VLISTVNSATYEAPGWPNSGGLLIADECHRYGASTFATALLDAYDHRLGLTATFERSDEGLNDFLIPYFGGVCCTYGYERAVAERITAQWKVALVGVPFSVSEREKYDEADAVARSSRQILVGSCGVASEPFGEFMLQVAELAKSELSGLCVGAARAYLKAFTERREVLANARAKLKALEILCQPIAAANRTLVFTQTIGSPVSAEGRSADLRSLPFASGERSGCGFCSTACARSADRGD
jgi:superfamily II DNA or RNA helicase